ncbi:hypothetical protein NDS46_30465 (plasmid) [Paenibacillus thiaminolyticus]|uniref:hypothetical protein n=1 Tax=Paenibacillus thiaminolyticus TaxID=49283 RepID=UPI00232EFEB1|nr:hypothetical protein [Paenibacillus thiaminolyticus]WCF11673.1 hypothetical protein NDS46_30465 [Paenibacillus thiaminolyticus]
MKKFKIEGKNERNFQWGDGRMKVKEVFFALNEIERQLCLLAIGDSYDETRFNNLIQLKFKLLNCGWDDQKEIAEIIDTINKNMTFI